MPQSDGYGRYLRRMALELKDGGWYYFKVNPSNYNHSEPQRATVMKTKSNVVVEDFGKDIETITFSGTTGWAKDSLGRTGADRMKMLRDYIRKYANMGGNGNKSRQELTFHNFTDGESYIVHLAPEGISLERDVEQPILYNYKISLLVIRDARIPADNESVDPAYGNTDPSIGAGTSKDQEDDKKKKKTLKPMSTGQVISNNVINSMGAGSIVTGVINPRGNTGAYAYGVSEIKRQIGYGEG